jgi:hypothetical protein
MYRILGTSPVRRYPILAETQWRLPGLLSRVVCLPFQTSLDSRLRGSDDIGQDGDWEKGICEEFRRRSPSCFALPRC